MSDPAPLIQYASEALEQPSDRLLRHIVAGTAIVEGGTSVLQTALRVALANRWLATPNTMAWGFDTTMDVVMTALGALMMSVLLVGGVLLLTRSRFAPLILRSTAAASIALTIIGTAIALRDNATYATYWSKPATAAVEGLGIFKTQWPEILIGLLTLPPLARRMV